MLLRESIEKTKTFLQTTLHTLKTILFDGYHKLPKPHFNPFSCGSGDDPDRIADHEYYTNFCNELECDLDKVLGLMANTTNTSTNTNTIMVPSIGAEIQSTCHVVSPTKKASNSPLKKKRKKKKKRKESGEEEKNSSKKSGGHCKNYGVEEEQEASSNKSKKGKKSSSKEDSYIMLARKMKELEMMDVSDVEHILDVEEAIHYYSRLKSPVYLDIVDKFFTDIYQDFSISQTSSVTANSSKRRLGSFRL